MYRDKYNPEVIRQAFKFLVDEYGYRVTIDMEYVNDDQPYLFLIEYEGNDWRVRLDHDYKENFFYFTLIRGINTKFPNEMNQENIRAFFEFFRKCEPQLDLKSLQPQGQTLAEAARKNAELLKKCCSDVLRGEAWF